MPYYIRHINMDAHHYVCVDVLSDYSWNLIPYYIHYKRKCIYQDVRTDIF